MPSAHRGDGEETLWYEGLRSKKEDRGSKGINERQTISRTEVNANIKPACSGSIPFFVWSISDARTTLSRVSYRTAQ